jgi:hypothetical protein
MRSGTLLADAVERRRAVAAAIAQTLNSIDACNRVI